MTDRASAEGRDAASAEGRDAASAEGRDAAAATQARNAPGKATDSAPAQAVEATTRAPLTGAMELMWAPPDRARRGPKPALSLDKILRTGIELADRDGLASLSMSKLAAELGFTTMSLYRYVVSKDDLVLLMVNEAAARPPALPAESWRDALEMWNREQISVLMRHPWIAEQPISGPPMTPNQLAWVDVALQALVDTPLTEQEKFAVVQVLATVGLAQVRLITEIRAAAARGATDPVPFELRLASLVTEAEYPAIYRSVTSGDLSEDTGPPDPLDDPDFLFGVHRFLDGIEAYIAHRSRPAAR